MKIEYGDGIILTQQAKQGNFHCLALTKCDKARPIGSTPEHWEKQSTEDEIDVLIVFKNIEGARVLQDTLNEVICAMSKEQSPVVP